jgi:hypothetical protein
LVGRLVRRRFVERLLGLVVGGETVCFLPPGLKVAPGEAVSSDRSVVDEDAVGIVDDFDAVVDGVADADVWFGG